MRRSKRFTGFLILIFLLSTFVVVSHHHENTADDHDCPICVASNHQSATGSSIIAFDSVPYFTETTVVALSPVFTDNLFSYSLRNRAPPA
jgi:hypothetical protein